jgi:superfamily II DNA or RNA helicase
MDQTASIAFQGDDVSRSVKDRLKSGIERARLFMSENAGKDDAYALRPDQVSVFQDTIEFLADAAERQASDELPMGRIILPSRTGKTVVAGKCLAACGLTAAFIVPTKTLLEQAVIDLAVMLPGVPVGYYYSDGKNIVAHGVNVITYHSLISFWEEDGRLPDELATAAVIFADEGHTSMTAKRMEALTRGFDGDAPRIAMTATPDYNFDRMLEKYFPALIHELSLAEAMELDLLAPERTWVYEVDVDASRVRMIAGSYDGGEIGSIMSAAPFFKMAKLIRYSEENINRSTLICCASRQQASDLLAYLIKFRPKRCPLPALIDKDTPKDDRRRIIEAYERGEIDTIINVRAMLMGWNSPRCKVLIDLAPSTSHVLAMQKYFRPMTKWGDEEARIYIIMPSNLPKVPLLPTDFFLYGSGEYECGELIAPNARKKRDGGEREVKHRLTPVAGVSLKSRIVLSQKFERPKLDPKNREQIEAVCLSNPAIRPDKICGYNAFRWLYFNHELFKGHGWQLLRFVGVTSDKLKYFGFMAGMFAEAARNKYLETVGMTVGEERHIQDISCYDDAALFIDRICHGDGSREKFRDLKLSSRALFGPDEVESPDRLLVEKSGQLIAETAIRTLPEKYTLILQLHFGLDEKEPLTQTEVWRFLLSVKKRNIGRERVRQLLEEAYSLMRKTITRQHL